MHCIGIAGQMDMTAGGLILSAAQPSAALPAKCRCGPIGRRAPADAS